MNTTLNQQVRTLKMNIKYNFNHMSHIEDIFGNDPIDLVLRFHPNTVSAFNRFDLPISFEELKERVHERAFPCYFQKITEAEHKIIVPLQSDGYQIEFITLWHGTTFSYEATTRGNHKTTVREYIKIPEPPDFIKEDCLIKVIDISQPYRAKDELETLYNRVSQLNIPVDIDIDKENEIWFKYIDATQRIITKRQEPFAVKKYYPLLPIGGEMEKANRFKFKVDLTIEENREYRAIEEAMKKLDVQNVRFDSEGNVQLMYEDITRVLDPVLEQEFKGIIIRQKEIGCLIRINPPSLINRIRQGISRKGFIMKVNWDFEKKEIYIYENKNNNVQESEKLKIDLLEKFKLTRKGVIAWLDASNENGKNEKNDFSHLWQKNEIFGNRNYNTRKKDFKNYIWQERQRLNRNGFDNFRYEFAEIFSFSPELISNEFSEQDLIEMKRDLYALPFSVNYFDSSQSIQFDFIDQEDLIQKTIKLKELQCWYLSYKPEGFKYKVKTKLVSRKTHLDTLRERIEKLGGVEFEIDIPKQEQEAEEGAPSRKPKREKRLPIGMLSRRESNIGTLIFTVSTRYKEQKKAVKKLLEITEGRLLIGQVFPNLTGDAVKIQWLREAVGKLIQPTDKPNGKPVNPKLKDFIFDSSKAEQIFDETKVEEGSTFWNEVEKSKISKTLNTSQIKAILSALYANDLCLLQGPPGTGKTTVISEIIWQHIRQNANNPSGYKILLTSETNLAVDNALEKLVGAETTIVKPLRFGKAEKFEEEGKKYSLDRIMRWVDETYENQSDYENEQLETDADGIEEEIEREDLSNNAVQRWMLNIGNRAQRQVNPKYATVIRDWQIEMAQPTKEIKTLFKDKYLKYANVIGSTCSSCGSQSFKNDFISIAREADFRIYQKEERYKDALQNMIDQILRFEDDDFSKLNFLLNKFKIGIDELKKKLAMPDVDFLRKVYFSELNDVVYTLEKKPDAKHLPRLAERLGLGNTLDSIRQQIGIKTSVIFDAVIMDEASKATPPEMVLPLCFGKKSIIIGDHKQLPPMINEREFREVLIDEAEDEKLANEIGDNYLKESQFKRLITNPKVSPTIRATFDVQYRMHSQIGSLIQQFYPELENGLICGIKEWENIEDLNHQGSRHHGLYHEGFIKPHTHVIWVDVPEPETKDGTSRVNEMECETVKRVLKYLKHSEGFNEFQANWDKIKDIDKRKAEQEVGIISFYGNQIKKLKEVKKYAENDLKIPIRLNTVDKFQGMERNILIVSTVRSNTINDEITGKVISNVKGGGYSPWGFADSPERLNVALSRARRLLIVVGNRQHFANFRNKEGEAIYANVISQIRAENIINYKTLEKYK